MSNKRTELKVSAIRSGTVIDHIPSENTFRVFQILGLDHAKDQVYLGTNLESKKLGKKGIIKISGKYFQPSEINKIALVAPEATLIEIKEYEIESKGKILPPDTITRIVKCVNPKCVTNNQHVETKFHVVTDYHGKMKLVCHYCEKSMAPKDISFV